MPTPLYSNFSYIPGLFFYFWLVAYSYWMQLKEDEAAQARQGGASGVGVGAGEYALAPTQEMKPV